MWDRARRVLAVRLDSLGDVLMTTPALRALRRNVPGRRIALLTSSAGAAAGGLVPEVDEVLVYDAPWTGIGPARDDPRGLRAAAARLRRGRFDGAVIFTVSTQNPLPAALLCYLAGIPLRLAHCRENPYGLLTHWVREPAGGADDRHEVRRQLDLVAAVGARTTDERLSLRVPRAARTRVRDLLGRVGVAVDAPWVVIHPGARAPSRRYPWEGFAAAARRLVREDGWQVLFTGDRSEVGLVERIRAALDVPTGSLAGALGLGELAALLEAAPLLITNNTGPAHVAAAVGTPVVVLYALTNPQHTPWGVPHRVLFQDVPCRFCLRSACPEGHHHCLRLVTPDRLVQAARELMGRRTRTGSEAVA